MLKELAAYIPRDRVNAIINPDASLATEGVAMIADISGFTPLTEALTHGLSPDQGAEELTRALDAVFTPLIVQIHAYQGSVIKFGGDALIVWFGRPENGWASTVVRRALTAAWRMQKVMAEHGRISTPIGPVILQMKIGLVYGSVKRFSLGLSEYGFEDVLAGDTLERMAAAEYRAEPGQIVMDIKTVEILPDAYTVARWLPSHIVIDRLEYPRRREPWPMLEWPPAEEEGLVKRLAAYVPRQIYEALLLGQAQVAELKPVVSLFVQFHGLDYDGDAMVEEKLQTYFVTAQRVIGRYDGRLNRLITGDKGSLLHVIFGAPRSVEEQEARAVRCALDLQAECGGLPFINGQRIGVAMGRVFAGPVGGPERHDYTTMGDAINLSARLMQNAADDQVLLAEIVQQHLGPEFETADLGRVQVKGKADPVPVFAALGAATRPRRQPQKQLMPIFGREEETAVLRAQLEAAAAGQGGVVTLVGEVGMGKTLLLDTLRATSDLAWAEGMSLAYGQTLSGYLFIDLARDILDLPPGVGPDQTSLALQAFCADLFGPAQVEATYPYLARFMGLPLAEVWQQRLAGLSGENLRWQLFELIPDLFRRLCAREPLVLALDDLQWADPTSLQLLDVLLPLTAEIPLLLLLALRPERASQAWALRQKVMAAETAVSETAVHLTLAPLRSPSAAQLIAHYAPRLPTRVVDYLVEKGGGNPLFLVEMVRTLEAQGLLTDEADADLDRLGLDALDLPNSVQGLLLAQLDRLAVEARHTLQMASVIGKTFLQKVLAAIAGAERRLEGRLGELEERQYIQTTDPTRLGLAYAFRHGLIQESAYSTLLYERRRAYHRQVAEALQRLFPTEIAEQAAFLSYHYERAGDLDQAIYFTLQTADQARLLYAHEEAESQYRKALDLLTQQTADSSPDRERQARIHLKIAQTRANGLDFTGAQEHYDHAFQLLDQVQAERGAQVAAGADEVLRWGVLPEFVRTLDPALVEGAENLQIVSNLFEGLVELDSDWNVIPAVARRWQVLDDGRRYRFTLRSEQRWSDGQPLTAHDFVFAWRRNLHPETGAGMANQLYVVQGAESYHQGETADPATIGVRAQDELTLDVTLTAPVTYFPYLLAFPITFPQPAHVAPAQGTAWGQPGTLVSNGPFMVTSIPNTEIRLERNPHYRGFSAGDLQQVALRPVEPGLAQYHAGEVDWCRVDDQADLAERFPENSFVVQGLVTGILGFACRLPPFDRADVRRAFAQSVDQEALNAAVWDGVQRPARGGVVPPGMPGHSPELGLPFDPENGRSLLAAANLDPDALNGLKLAAFPGFQETPAFLRQSWQQHLGVRVDVADVPADQILPRLQQGAVHMVLLGLYLVYPDPDDVLRAIFHSDSPVNYFGWQNGRFDRLVDEAASFARPQERLALYHEADRVLVAEETAVMPLYYMQSYALLRRPFQLVDAGKILRGNLLKFKHIAVSG